MPFSLIYLERASGYAGSGGQSFQGNVLPGGGKPNVGMSQYKCDSWLVSGGPDPAEVYGNNVAFNLGVSFNQGPMAQYIKRQGSGVIVIEPSSGPDYQGPQPQMNGGFQIASASSYVDGSAIGSAYVQLLAPTEPPGPVGGHAWYTGYTEPSYPPRVVGQSYSVTFTATVGTTPASGGTMLQTFRLYYKPDNGPFNPDLWMTFPITMLKRDNPGDTTGYQWKWYTSSARTTLHAEGLSFSENIQEGVDVSYYLSYLAPGASQWVNVANPVTYHDTRPESGGEA